MHLSTVSAILMAITSSLCVAGLLSKHFRDNLWQTAAMCCGMIGCASRAAQLWGLDSDIPFDWFLVHACMALFAIGVAWKVIWFTHTDRLRRLRAAIRERFRIDPWGGMRDTPIAAMHRRHDDL